MGSPREHNRSRAHPSVVRGVRSSSCLVGSFLIQMAVQVHGNSHGCDLGVEKDKSAPCQVSSPSMDLGHSPEHPSPVHIRRKSWVCPGKKTQ